MLSFSLVFLTNTALLLGNGQLHQQYGISQHGCQNELFRSARIVQAQGANLTDETAQDLTKRIVKDCYDNRVRVSGDSVVEIED